MTDAEDIATAVETVAAEARRLGLVWRLLKGTVFNGPNTPSLTMVTLDGDTEPSRCISMAGQLPAGSRVFVVVVPPAGNYVVGVGSGTLRQWSSTLTQADADLNLVAATNVVSGTPQTITVPPGVFYEADLITHFQKIGANAATVAVATLFLDGVQVGTQQCIWASTEAATGARVTFAQNWAATAVAAGSHTWDVRAMRVGGADGTIQVRTLHTTLRLRLFA